MSQGKYLSLEEARKEKKLKRFAKDHPSKGNKTLFNKLFKAMASGEPPKGAKVRTKPKGAKT
jgi:hypothetical protein